MDPYAKRLLSTLGTKDPHRVFASTPAGLLRLVGGMTREDFARRPPGGRWPVAWIVHHLADAEVGMAFRIRMALAESGARFPAFDQDRWARGLGYDRRSVRASLATFTALRRSHVELLSLSGRSARTRYGIHEERGRESVERMVRLMAGHDLNHLDQIRKARAPRARRSRPAGGGVS